MNTNINIIHIFIILKEQGKHRDIVETSLYLEEEIWALSSCCHKVCMYVDLDNPFNLSRAKSLQ